MITYHEVLQMSTFVQISQDVDESSSVLHRQLVDTEFILRKLVWSRDQPEGGLENFQENMDFQDGDCQLFSKLYGFSYNLLRLVSETALLANEIDRYLDQKPELPIPLTLHSQIRNLEVAILAESTSKPPTRPEWEVGLTSLSSAISEAMYNALIVYFFRRVRKTNPAILQHYVKIIFKAIKEQDDIKLHYDIDSGFLMWPIFIAACEAVGKETRRAATAHLRRIGNCGFRSGDTAEIVARELWNRRDQSDENLDFRDILRDLGMQIVLL
jgi:arginine metabolism regulation protein II